MVVSSSRYLLGAATAAFLAVSVSACHTQPPREPAPGGAAIAGPSSDTAPVLRAPPLREAPTQDAGTRERQRFRDRNERDADIARGPVPGYAGIMAEGTCGFVVLLTDTLAQKGAADAYVRSEVAQRRGCGGSYRLSVRQVKYDFAQLYDWYVGAFRAVWREPGLVSTDIDEARNQLAVGVEDSAAYRRMLRVVDTIPIPKGVIRVDVSGRDCVGTGGPSVVVEVRDPRGRPAAIGTTIVIQDEAFRDSVDGSHAISEVHVGAGERRPGRYEVRIFKPGYKPVVLRGVMAPGDTHCQYAEPTDVRKVTLELLPNAPKVRSVVVLPPRIGFGLPDLTLQLRAVVDADSGVSPGVSWTSSDTTVAGVSATGVVRSKCREASGNAIISATSLADPRVRGQARVAVWPSDARGVGAEPGARKAAECPKR